MTARSDATRRDDSEGPRSAPTQVRAVIFDLGNVLLDFDHARMVRQVAELLAIDAAALNDFWFGTEPRFWQLENGQFDGRNLFRQTLAEFGATASFDEFAHAVGEIFTVKAGMRRLLDELRAHGVTLVLLSNTSDLHIDFIRRHFDTLSPFASLVLSYEERVSKPVADIYQTAVAKTDHDVTACLYIDDRIENIAGAEAIGLAAHHFTTESSLRTWLQHHRLPVTAES